MIPLLLLWSSVCLADPLLPKYDQSWNDIQKLLDKLPPPSSDDYDDEPVRRGKYPVDSHGREYVIRMERREVNGVVVWRVWQQYLDLPESKEWADYVPPSPPVKRHRRLTPPDLKKRRK